MDSSPTMTLGYQCGQFEAQSGISYINCTGSDFISNWTEFCCQPEDVRDTRLFMLSVIGTVGILGIIVNIGSISTLLYLLTCHDRIKKKFQQDLARTHEPVFLLVLHLSLCDLLYCLIGLTNYWDVYYYGYYPHSHNMCRGLTFARFAIAYADFTTLAMISLHLASTTFPRTSCYPCTPSPAQSPRIYHRGWAASRILAIWIYSIGITSLHLLGNWGQFGYDRVHGKCTFILYGRTRGDLIMSSLGIIIPGIIIISSYGLVFIRVHRVESDEEEQTGSKSSRNLTKSLVKLSFSYLIFTIPIWIIKFFNNTALVAAILHGLYWPTYVVNFFIYILAWDTFQLAAKNLVKDIMETVFGIVKKQTEEFRMSSSHTQMRVPHSTRKAQVLSNEKLQIPQGPSDQGQ